MRAESVYLRTSWGIPLHGAQEERRRSANAPRQKAQALCSARPLPSVWAHVVELRHTVLLVACARRRSQATSATFACAAELLGHASRKRPLCASRKGTPDE